MFIIVYICGVFSRILDVFDIDSSKSSEFFVFTPLFFRCGLWSTIKSEGIWYVTESMLSYLTS